MDAIATIILPTQDAVDVYDWDGLVEAINNTYTNMKLVVDILRDIDMNEPPYNEGITQGIKTGSSAEVTINGNGHKLKNVFVIRTTSSGSTPYRVFNCGGSSDTYRLNIVNWDISCLAEGRYAYFAYGRVFFSNCDIQVKVHGSNVNNSAVGFYRCGVTIEGQGDGNYNQFNTGESYYADESNFLINGKFDSLYIQWLRNSYVSGDFESIQGASYFVVSNNYLGVLNASIKSTRTPTFGSLTSFAVNTETWTGPDWDTIEKNGLIKCTTADLQSQQTMNGLDFPV